MDFSILSFTYPLILTTLALLPILWLLLRALPQAPKRQMFPGHFFLKRIKNSNETPSRAPWYILLMRLIALAAVIIAVAEPVLNNPEKLTRDGPVVIVLDDGWPAADGWTLRQNALRMIAAELTESSRLIWLLTTSPMQRGDALQALRGPLTPDQLSEFADTMVPTPFAPDRFAALTAVQQIEDRLAGAADIRWLSDGIFVGADIRERQFLRRMKSHGVVTAYRPDEQVQVLSEVAYRSDRLQATIRLPGAATEQITGFLSILARNGRLLQKTAYLVEEGANETSTAIDLPLTLRNDIGLVRLDAVRSAAAVQLADASTRRALVGLVGSEVSLSGTLLDSQFYLEQALAPYALFSSDTVGNLAGSDATVIILDDIGRVRETDAAALKRWVANGGVLIRFAGPVLADASQDVAFLSDQALLPVPLRGGGRAFGGALTWEKPQKLGGFAEDSPFSDLKVDPQVEIRRQVLARPGADTSIRSWAYLEDGTPLVTARAEGKGLVVLFHVTAAPDWSDLPISGLFVEMLRRLTALSVTEVTRVDPDQSYVPRRILNGFGRLEDAPDDARPVKAADAIGSAARLIPPGLYGDPASPLAINAVTSDLTILALDAIGAFDGMASISYAGREIRSLAEWFFVLALILILLDTVLVLYLNGKLPGLTGGTVAAGFLICVVIIAPFDSAQAQPRPALDAKAIDSALYTRFAYVVTGDREADELSKAGLFGLSMKLRERTALEPADPVSITPATDDLSVYPLIYWPVLATTPIPSENTLLKLEAFMAGGGLVIFDTRDGDRIVGSQQTEEGAALRRILEQLNVPPLEPLPVGHVLRRSFYLMEDLPGRNDQGPIWVESRSAAGSLNDGVTPIIIGGRDWAAAWAVDSGGRPLRPMGPGAAGAREIAIRSGINIAMVALTGNYKVDQLQAETLLDKIGREQP